MRFTLIIKQQAARHFFIKWMPLNWIPNDDNDEASQKSEKRDLRAF